MAKVVDTRLTTPYSESYCDEYYYVSFLGTNLLIYSTICPDQSQYQVLMCKRALYPSIIELHYYLYQFSLLSVSKRRISHLLIVILPSVKLRKRDALQSRVQTNPGNLQFGNCNTFVRMIGF